MAPVFFHGTDAERDDLLACLARNCACAYAPVTNIRMSCCPGHQALSEDQKFVDRMVFMRRQRDLLVGQEFHPKKEKR